MCEYVCAFVLLPFFVWWEEGGMEAGVAKALKSRSILPLGKAKERWLTFPYSLETLRFQGQNRENSGFRGQMALPHAPTPGCPGQEHW